MIKSDIKFCVPFVKVVLINKEYFNPRYLNLVNIYEFIINYYLSTDHYDFFKGGTKTTENGNLRFNFFKIHSGTVLIDEK